jgi:hypothetical protein
MSVRIARLRSGEDIIAGLKEVLTKETEQVAAIQCEDPYAVALVEDTESMFERSGNPIRMSNPKVHMVSWVPLSANRVIYLDPNEIICVYDPHTQVLEQYSKILEAMNGAGNDGDGDSGRGESAVDSEDSSTEGS